MERIKQKIEWEGGLDLYIDYGVSKKLYKKFKKEFDIIYEGKEFLRNFEEKLMNYLNERKELKEYTDDEMNSVNYILNPE